MDAIRRALEPLFADDSESLTRIVDWTRDIDADSPRWDEATNEQFVHGFAAIVREALAGDSREARDLYTASAAAVLAAEGRAPSDLARSLVVFGSLLGVEVAVTADPEVRTEAAQWLALFVGTWTEELLEAMEEART